jgi:ATP-binding cassette subfamily F protein uup
VLEQKLCEYTGTLIVVSHDRDFLDNVVTSTVVFESGGEVREYVGGYSDWLRQGHSLTETDNPLAAERRKQQAAERRRNRPATKLSYKDQRELDSLPDEIESLETKVAGLQASVAAPGFYAQPQDDVQAVLNDLADTEALLESRVERWGELEALQSSMSK